jgi:hypothetical protein
MDPKKANYTTLTPFSFCNNLSSCEQMSTKSANPHTTVAEQSSSFLKLPPANLVVLE